jgi:hypothetical protein
LPPPEPNGEIRYLGTLATSTFRETSYVLRLVAQQATSTAAEETPFTIAAPVEKPMPPIPWTER